MFIIPVRIICHAVVYLPCLFSHPIKTIFETLLYVLSKNSLEPKFQSCYSKVWANFELSELIFQLPKYHYQEMVFLFKITGQECFKHSFRLIRIKLTFLSLGSTKSVYFVGSSVLEKQLVFFQ